MEIEKLSIEKLVELMPEWSIMTHYRVHKGYTKPSTKYFACLNARLASLNETISYVYKEEFKNDHKG